MNYRDNKAKRCHLKNLTCTGTLRQVLICQRLPPLLGFCLGWPSSFVGSDLLRHRVLNFCRILSPTGLSTPHPLSATLCLHTFYFTQGRGEREGEGRGEPERRLEGQQFLKLVEITNMTDCISSL